MVCQRNSLHVQLISNNFQLFLISPNRLQLILLDLNGISNDCNRFSKDVDRFPIDVD